MQRKSKAKSRRQRRNQSQRTRDTRQLKLEALENREMFAADLVYSDIDSNPLIDDLRLEALQSGGNLSVRLMRGATQVATAALDDAGDVTINVKRDMTTAGDIDPFSDSLRIDLNSLGILNSFVVANGGVLTVNFEGGVTDPIEPLSTGDHLFLESNGTSAIGYGLSVITTADITLNAVSASFNGNLLLRSNPNSTASGTTLDLATVLALPAAKITVNGGAITATNITLEADAEKTLIVTPDSDIPVAEVIVNSSANIAIQNSAVITATGTLTILAESNMTTNVGRAPVADGDATDDDAEEDAAIAISVINNVTNVTINSGATLSSNGATLITSNNLVTATSIADGMLGSDSAGGTLAMTTVNGDTVLLVDGATITSGGNLSLLSNSIRSATTQASATPGGVKDDDDSTTTTRGETELEEADAETSEGSVDFAAAIAIGEFTGNTTAEINNATVKSTGGNLTHQAKAKHTVITKADGSTTSNESDSGIGVAVAIQNTNTEALARILGTSSVDGNNVFVDARHDDSNVTIDALSGAAGTSSSDDVGFAGSLAIGVTKVNSRAKIENGASVDANGANLILNSNSKTTTTVRGLPLDNGVSLGVGASFALNIVDQTTQATVGDAAILNNAAGLSLTATSDHTKTTETRTGAAGGTAFAGAFSILVDNDDTLATLGTGASTNVGGNLSLLADSKTQTTTKAQGDAQGGEDAGIGAAFGLAYSNVVTDARTNRNLTVTGNMNITATSSGDADVLTSASASGGKKSGANGGEKADAKAADARANADSRADANDARTSSTTEGNPASSNSDGAIAVAAAFAINLPEWETRATIPTGRSVTVDGQLTVKSFANHDASAVADASAVKAEELGVGIAVALISADVVNAATIGTSTVSASGVTVEANMRNLASDQQHTFEARASSGAGESDNSIAGAFSLGINTIKTLATINNLANVDANQQDVIVTANSDASHKVYALPEGDASGNDFGLGLSFAFGAVDEITTAAIGAGATLTEVGDLKITAKSKSSKDNLAQAGAAGDTAFAGALSILISHEDTLALVETRADNTVVAGNVDISADHTGTATSIGDADAVGGDDAGIGVTGSFAYLNELTDAQLQRDMTITGNLSILSTSSGSSSTETKASASGAKKSNETTDSKAQSQRDFADSSAEASGARTSEDTPSNPSASTNSGGSVAVAAAVTINVAETVSRAAIPENKTVSVGGVTTIRAKADHDRFATADGSAVLDGGDLAVGVAVALIGGSIDNEATIGNNTTLTTDGLTLEAVMLDPTARHQFEAKATSGAGGGDYGIAGSVTVAILDADATATIGSEAKIQGLASQPVIIQAVANTTNLGEAKPTTKTINGSTSFGLGGSFSLVRTTHDVTATVSPDATISSGASSLTVAALADHDTTSIAVNGAKGKDDDNGNSSATGIGAAVSLVLSQNQTHALVDTAGAGITVTGDAVVRARHKHKINGQADGTVTGAATGIGISFGMNQVDDHASATLNRSLSANNVTIESIARVDSDVETYASTSGTGSDSNNPDEEANAQRNPSNSGAASNTGDTKPLPKSSEQSEKATDSSSDQSGSGSGDLGVAASVAFNIIEMNNKAKVGAGAVVTATQTVRVSANGHFDALAKGLGESVTTGESDTVAAGVGFNYVDTDSMAEVGVNAQLTGSNITIESITADADSATSVNEFVSWGSAASGGDGDYSVAASVAFNFIKMDYQATSAPGSSLKSTGDLTVQTEADIQPQTMALAGALTTGDAYGGSLAYAEVDLVSKARIDGNADVSDALQVDADSIVRTTPTTIPEVGGSVDLNTLALAGAAGGDSFALAASLAVDDYSITTTASIGPNSQINQTPGWSASNSQSVTVEATSDTDVTTLVGSAALSLDGTGAGAGVQIGILSNTTTALIETNADVDAKYHVTVKANSDEKLIAGSTNAGIGDSNGVAGSVAIYDVHTDTYAAVDDIATVDAGGNVSITANGNFALTGIAGSIGVGGTTGAGAANTTLLHDDDVQARIGAWATVTTKGQTGLTLKATSTDDIIGVTAAGAGGGDNALAGAATILVLNEATQAFVKPGATITADNGLVAGAPGVEVSASDTTNIVTVAGNLAVSGNVAVGVGADITTLNKTTLAFVDSNVKATVEGDMRVLADSVEDITCVAAGVSVSSTGVAVDAAVTILDIKTRAFIGDDHLQSALSAGPGDVHARGNIIVDANNNSQFDKVIGVVGVGTTGAGAAAVAVSSTVKLTEAFIGQGAKVNADGQGSSALVKTGKFDITYDDLKKTTTGINATGGVSGSSNVNALKEQGEVGQANADEMKPTSDSGSATTDPSNNGQRKLTPTNRSGFRGLSVTASSRDDIEVYTISVAIGGSLAVAVTAGVSAVDNETMAYISNGAQINTESANAHTDQSVNVTAGSDFSQIAINGSLAAGTGAALSPAVGVALVNLKTEAAIAGTVKAKDDVLVQAHGSEDVLLVGMGLAAGSVGVGGTVNVMDFKPTTTALIQPNAIVVADGDVLVEARDESDVDLISGAAGIGITAGVGAGVGVMMFTKETEATISSDAHVDAFGDGPGIAGVYNGEKQSQQQDDDQDAATGFKTSTVKGVVVQASSYDNYMHLCAVAGFGYIGVAGGVGVTLIDSDTSATIESGAHINQLNNNSNGKAGQSVYVNSVNQVEGFSFAGSVAGGIGAVAGAVDFGTIKNDSLAVIETGAKVRAVEDVEVNALSIKDVEGFAISGAGGLVGIAGSVSVWSIGAQLNKQYKNDEQPAGNADQDQSGKTAEDDAGKQAENAPKEITKSFGKFEAEPQKPKASKNRQFEGIDTASGRLSSKTPSKSDITKRLTAAMSAEPGTTAKIAAGATIQAGDDINVTSNEDTNFQSIIGSVAGGAVGVGGSVAVNTFSTNSTARAGGTLIAGGDLNVISNLDQDTNTYSIAGAGGLAGLGAAVVSSTDSSAVQAYVDNGANIPVADNIVVKVNEDRLHKGETGQVSIGGIAAGVSFVVVNIENAAVPTSAATIGDNVTIGSLNAPVQNVTVEAKPKYAVDTNVFGLSGGVAFGASINFSRANVRPETHATIGKANVYAAGEVRVTATPTIDAEVTGTGVAVGGGAAAGVMLANLEVGRGHAIDEVQAGVQDGAKLVAESVVIEANSIDTLDVQSVAGAGAVLGGSYAKSTLKSDQSTLAHLGSGSSIVTTSVVADSFFMQASHDQDVDSQADAVTVALAAGSGAGLENTLTGRAKSLVGKATVDAREIVINADNSIDKNRYGVGDGVNLATVSVSGGSVTGLESKTSIGTADHPTLSLVDIRPNAVLRAHGTADKPGILNVDVSNDIDAVDRTYAEEYSLSLALTIATSSIDVQSRSMINVDGATLENKYGAVNLTSHTDSQTDATSEVNAASLLSAQIASNAITHTSANQKINLSNATLIGKDIRVYSGQDRSRSSNRIANVSVALGSVKSLVPNFVPPLADATILEDNDINILGTSKLEAFADIDLITREGFGEGDRAFAAGSVASLSALPIDIDANTVQKVDSFNDVDISNNSKLTAGLASYAAIHIVPVIFDGSPHLVGGQPVTLGAELNGSAKEDLKIPANMDYHYSPIELGDLTFDFYKGYVVQPVAGSAPGANLSHYYQFLPSTVDGALPIIPHLENYADASRWKDLGALTQAQLDNLALNAQSVFKSNILVEMGNQLSGKFAMVKPIEMDGARLVYRNVGNLLYQQYQEIKEWMLQHQGDPEAIARYQVQLEELETLMLELGVAEVLNPGHPELSFNTGLNTLFVEVPSLIATPGSVYIEASGLPPSLVTKYQPLINTKVLNAHAGANIDIYNKSPFAMVSDGALAEDNQRTVTDDKGNFLILVPGNVFVNNIPLTANGSSITSQINITQNDLGPLSKYGLNNLPVPLPKIDQDLYINGDVINEAGNIRIENTEGSIYVNGEIRGASVEIFAANDFNLNTEGWYHTNRDPRQLIDYNKYREDLYMQAEALRDLAFNDQWTNLANPAKTFSDAASVLDANTNATLAAAIATDDNKILSQGDIVITARFLNVNGLIQSGSDEIAFHVDNDFVAPNTTTNFLTPSGKQLLPGLTFGAAGVPIEGCWDAARDAFVIAEIKPEGGRIRIAGQILSTGNGRLKVATGNPSVNIDNDSPYLVILEGIDTSKARQGFIEVTDTHGPIATRVQYKFMPSTYTIEETRFNGVEVDSNNDGITDTIDYVQSGPVIVHGINSTIAYQPDADMHYVWSEGKRGIERTKIEYIENNDWYTYQFFFIDFDETNFGDRKSPEFVDDELLVTSETLEVEGDLAPGYANDQAYSLKYERHGDPRVTLKKGKTLVLNPLPNYDFTTFPPSPIWAPNTHVYEYIGDDDVAAELSEVDYSNTQNWIVSGIDPATFQLDPSEDKFSSGFKNDYTTIDGPRDIGNNKKRTEVTRERGVRDMYTHTLKADYPIGILFSKSPATPKIDVNSKGGILIIGDLQSPAGGLIELSSIGGSIETSKGVTIFGGALTVTALQDVRLTVEGDQGALVVNAGGKIGLNAVSLDNSSSSFVIGTVNSLAGDVSINAKDGLINKDSNSLITGKRIDLRAMEGTIGTSNSPLNIKAGSNINGGLTAHADGDIFILQTSGDMLLVRPIRSNLASVDSATGDVTLIAATGSILDGDNEFKKKAPSTTPSLLSQNFLNQGIAAGNWTSNAKKYAVSAGLVKFLYPHEELLGQNPPTEMTERLNVRGKKITLSALSVGQEVGHVGDAIIINNPKNFAALSEEQQSILANANATDVVGVAYGLYKFLGGNETNIDLTQENFANTSRWLKLNTHFATGLARTGESSQLLQAGDRVRVENDVDHYGVYEYFGPTEVLNLLQINYLDRTRWTKLTGDAATDNGPTNLANGMIIVNKFVVDSLILRPIQDVNIDAQTHIRSTASYRTALESADEMRLLRIESGDDMFLRSPSHVVDVGDRHNAAALASSGEVVISALGNVYAPGDTTSLRTQITNNGSLRILASGGVDVRQVSTDTTLSGVPVAINDLLIDRIDATGDVHIVVDEGNMRINYITSKTSIELEAQNAILDAFPAHKGIYVNIYTPATAVPGHVSLSASSIGTSQAPLTLDLKSGDLVTQTSGDQWIQAVSDLVATSLVSIGGNIVVQANNQVLIGLIEALAGNVTISAAGSILDFEGDLAADIRAIRITLVSSTGSIGLPGNDLEVDTADNVNGRLEAGASADIAIRETTGRLNVQHAISQGSGNIQLATNETAAAGEDIYGLAGGLIQAASGHVTLDSADNVQMLAAISGQNITIQADINSADALGANVNIGGPITAQHAEISTGDDADAVAVAAAVVTGFVIRTKKGEDQVTGGSGDDQIFGGDGRDGLQGRDGDDYLDAGLGIGDELYGQAGNDTLMGSQQGSETDPNFNDAVRFGDLLDGGDGNDTIRGLGGADSIMGGSGQDWIEAGDGSDMVRGGLDNDTLYAGDGLADYLHGDEGDDLLVGSNTGNDQLFGGTGDDRIYGQAGNDNIEAGDGNDYVDGGAGTDMIFGQAGNDELLAGTGAGDLIRGGDGDDVIRGSDDGPDNLFGEAGRDRIYGNAGNDTISGGVDDDILEGGAGDDLISGDEGSDLIVGGANHDVLYAFNATNLNSDNSVDYLYGDFGSNGNEANSGNDQLYGYSGRDLLYGEAGDDLIDDDFSIAGIPQPTHSLDLIDYGTDDGANPTTFTAPITTSNPLLQPPAAPMLPSRASYPSGASGLGRWGELSNSASGPGLNRSGITSAPAIASTPSGTVVAWTEGYLGRSRIYVAQHDGSTWQELPSPGSGVYVAGTHATNPSLIVTVNGLPTVAWTEHTATGSHIMLAQYSPAAGGGLGGWIALGNSLSTSGLSGIGLADHAQLIETSFGLVVVWQHQVGGVTQAYARVFNGSAWVAIGAGSDSAAGITNAGATADVRDVSVATRTGRVAIAWSQVDPATMQRQVYLREFNGTAWEQINNSATGPGVSAAVQGGLAGIASNNLQPSLAYSGNDLLVAWQTHSDSQPLVAVARYSNSTGNPQLVYSAAIAGSSAQAKLISSGSQTQLVWMHDATRLFAVRWNGSAMIEELPGEASGLGITSTGRSIETLTASIDASGRASIGWLDVSQGTPNLMVRRNAMPAVGFTYVASADGASIQSILDSHNLVAGDVIVVNGVLTGDVTISAADSGVLLIGLPGSQIIGNVNVTGNQVGLKNLNIGGSITATNASQFYLQGSSIAGRIVVHGGTGNEISYNHVAGNNAGVVLSGNTNLPVVRYNQVTGGTNGISIGDPADVLTGGAIGAAIHNNTLANVATGIQVRVASSGSIMANQVVATQAGLDLDAAWDGLISQNRFSQAAVGVRYEFPGLLSDNEISHNEIGIIATVNSDVNGLGFQPGTLPNRIVKNTVGVELTGRMQNQFVAENVTGVVGSGDLVSHGFDKANVIQSNQVGVNIAGDIKFQRIARNQVGIQAASEQSITNNLIYRNTLSVEIVGKSQVNIQANTFYTPIGTHVQLTGATEHVHLFSNIFWTEDGYNIYVANESTTGFASDYNLLHTTGNGKIAFWTKDFNDILDWQEDVARFDSNSIGRTSVNPTWSNPRFVDREHDDYRLFGQVARQRFSSPAIDAGLTLVPSIQPPPPVEPADIGAYSGTSLDVAQPAHLVLISPDLYEDWDRDRAIAIRWQSYGNTNNSPINIDLYQDTATGPVWIANIATGVPDIGQYAWMASTSGIGYGTYGLRIQVSFTNNRTVLSRSTETFTVPESGKDYYVNDNSTVGDDLTSAVGNNRHTGKLPSAPKPYPNNVLRNYTLTTSDNLWVDTGAYALLNPLVISSDKDLGGDDQGFTMQGAFGGPLTVLTHANPLTAAPVVNIRKANNVTLTDLVLTGGTNGLAIQEESAGAKLLRVTATQNSADGIYTQAGTQVTSMDQVIATLNAGSGVKVEGTLGSINQSTISHNGATGLVLNQSGPTQVTGNVIANNVGPTSDGVSIVSNHLQPVQLGADDLALQNGNRIFGNGRHGVNAQGNVHVIGNAIYGHTASNASGVLVTGAAEVSDNVVHGNTHGITANGPAKLTNNRVVNNSGIGLDVNGASASANVVYSNNIGIQSNAGNLTNNLVYDNNLVGVALEGSVGSILVNNTIHQQNGTAIQLLGTNPTTQMRNNIVWADGGKALATTPAAFAGTTSNYNDYHLTSGAILADWAGDSIASLASFQALTGTDATSYTVDPSFVNPYGSDAVMGYVNPTSDGRDDDFHLRSTAGTFRGGAFAPVATNNGIGLPAGVTGAWETFATHSLLIDAGWSADPTSNEPAPNGSRINLGAYGNTVQASKSAIPYLNVLSPNGNEAWLTKNSYWILWNADDLNSGSTTYRIELLRGAAVVLNIASAAPDTGVFGWTIPTNLLTGNDYSIRISRNSGNGLVDSSNAMFSIINANVAPALTGAYNFPNISEDIAQADNAGTLVSTMVAGRFSDQDGPAAGIAITAVNNTQGSWEYALDGISFSDIQSQLTGGRVLLLSANSAARLRFRPNSNFFGNAGGVSYVAWDQADITPPGSAVLPGSLQVNSLGTSFSLSTITVTAVNDAPSDVSISNASVKEKLAVGTTVGIFGSVDVDPADSLTYTLVAGAGSSDNARFTFVGNELRIAEVFDFETKPTHSIRVRTTDSAGAFYEKSFTIQVLNAPIKVTGIYVRGSNWNSSYLAMLAANNLGSTIGGFRLIDGPNQLANSSLITWQTIDQISVTFDEPGAIDSDALRILNGNNQDLVFAAGGYRYDAASRTARWTLNGGLAAGRFLVSLEAAMIRDGASASLDGEWTTSVSTYASSGNETAGGDLNFQFHYLPGDVSRNGQTNPGDVNLLRSLGTIIPNATNFWMDVTGNNQINPGDVNFVRSLGTVILSGAVPTNPPPPRSGNSLMSTFGSKLESEDKLGEKKADNATHRELQLGPSQSPPASLTAATLKPKNRKEIHDQSLLSYMDELDEIPFLLDDFDNILRRPVRRIP